MSILLDPATPITGDVLRIVTFSDGGRPIEALNLNDGTGYFRQRDADFTFTPAASSVQYSSTARRYGGARAVGQTHENGTIAWTCYVKGTSDADVRTRIENLLAEIAEVGRGRYVEWAPGSGQSSFFELAGPGDWQPAYQVRQFIEGFTVSVQLTFPVLPLVQWAPMAISDPFTVDSTSDYTFDTGSGTLSVTGGQLVPSSTVEKALYHSARGYSYEDAQGTHKFTTGASVAAGPSIGVRLRRLDASNYLYGDLIVAGVASTLKITKKDAGSLLTLATGSSFTLTAATTYWLRARAQGDVITVELFTAAPTPLGTPAQTLSFTLTGADKTKFGAGIAGQAGIRWNSVPTDWRGNTFTVEPYVYRNQTLPQTIQLGGSIPGNAPALADITITPSGGSNPPVSALIAWSTRPGTPVAGVAPFGILEAETAGDLTGWTSTASAGARSGNLLKDATVSGAETYAASWIIDPSTLDADDFTSGELALELWAIVVVNAGLVTPKLTASIRPVDGLNFGAERFTQEWGASGKLLTVPSSGERRRPTRLGTLPLTVDPLRPRQVKLWITGATASGSTGTFGIDYLMPVLARARALSPTGEPRDGTYPKFVTSTNETSKTIRADLSGTVAAPPANPYPDHGLGGNLLELPPGPVDMLIKLSSLVPDDPTSDTSDEQLAHSATVSINPTPRSFLLRDA